MKFSSIPIWGQLLMFVVLGAGGVIAAEKFLFEDYKQKIIDLDKKITALEIEIKKGQAIEDNLPEFERQVKMLSEELEDLKKILPPKKEAQELIRKIASLASQSDLTVQRWTDGQVVTKEHYHQWPISLSVSGSYHNLAKFYEKIGNYRRIINIANIRMKVSKPQSKSKTLTADYTAFTYVYRD